MRINISKYFRKALERHRIVDIDGLGTFSIVHRSAELDHGAGAVQPPAESVDFETTGEEEAIAFSDFLSDMLGVKDRKAEQLVGQWVDYINRTLSKDGQVVINGLGTLERNGDQLDWTSFQDDDLALQVPWPVLFFHPLKREGEPTGAAANAVSGSSRSPWFWIAGIAAVIMLMAAFAYWTLYQSPDKPLDLAGIDQSRINKSPRIDSYYVRDTHLPPETTARRQDQARKNLSMTPEDSLRVNRAKPSEPDEDKTVESDTKKHNTEKADEQAPSDCIVVVGAFAMDQNVQKMLNLLEEKGYTTYTEPHDTLTRVGVRTPCLNEELLNTLRACRVGVEENAWILGRRPQ